MNYKNMGKVMACMGLAACVCGGNVWGAQAQKSFYELTENEKGRKYIKDGKWYYINDENTKASEGQLSFKGVVTINAFDSGNLLEALPAADGIELVDKEGKLQPYRGSFRVSKNAPDTFKMSVTVKSLETNFNQAQKRVGLFVTLMKDNTLLDAEGAQQGKKDASGFYLGSADTRTFKFAAGQEYIMEVTLSTELKGKKLDTPLSSGTVLMTALELDKAYLGEKSLQEGITANATVEFKFASLN